MKQGFKISTLISFTISNYFHHHKSLHRTTHHVDSPFLSRFFSSSSSYNNRSNGGGRPPPPRHRSGDSFTPSNRTSSSSRLSGFIDGNDDCGENRGRGRRDFDTNRNPNYSNDSRVRPSNRSDNQKLVGSSSYRSFDDDDDDDDDDQKPQFSRNRKINDNKNLDVDGFIDRFKLGFDQEKSKLNSVKLEGELACEEQPPPPPENADEIFRKMKETGLKQFIKLMFRCSVS